ncbi:undecaprenyl-diphosphate phosphatase [archaeon]|jgi:undecaprenyl-diphosphatase|nr:undecaprenyl-diphosphate phosphatase [archaeon]MBT6762432.1 undecaprenyl-diphosphate phosphatase [archaeon]
MEIWQSLILGIVQGITEWLPISSSGHLVIFQQMFGLSVPLSFDILLHFSTLLVLLTVYYKDLVAICKSWIFLETKSTEFKLGLMLIIGSIPTALIGLYFKDSFVLLYGSLLAVGIAELFTAGVLFLSSKAKENQKLSAPSAILIGIAQGIAIIPGVSRSGTTISAGLLLGLKREAAAKYSFLLALPAIAGATILEGPAIFSGGIGFVTVMIGMITSYIVGLLTLKWLLKLIQRKSFYMFGWYCLGLGLILVGLSVFF